MNEFVYRVSSCVCATHKFDTNPCFPLIFNWIFISFVRLLWIKLKKFFFLQPNRDLSHNTERKQQSDSQLSGSYLIIVNRIKFHL